jgi:hypothetical protein
MPVLISALTHMTEVHYALWSALSSKWEEHNTIFPIRDRQQGGKESSVEVESDRQPDPPAATTLQPPLLSDTVRYE